ncbi:antibiotic ABC transporter ATP-binding protein [Flavobacterium sp. 316]|uniref:ABC transporter ATP-binding protein n=1 Tax=Flavobacterium sp. 316 TaxID=1603293 RepID=UPI0005E36FC3|nr:ABC transporter ATP-binding protein [Flavobacterium sp. 316]KIX22105.1 antibiotic ABC transporter ATP-binding protein [Flavobacterium sp. 316]
MKKSTFYKILKFALPYKRFAFLNIFFNILYALFNALSFVMLIPMLDVMFDTTNKVYKKPVYTSIFEIKDFLKNYLDYSITTAKASSPENALLIMIALVISTFLLKNIFNYLAVYNVTFLRNGTLKDLRIALYKKVIHLPLGFYSEKRRGDVMVRLTNDVGEVQFSFLSILEIIFKEPLTIIITLIIMFSMSVELTIFVMIFIPLSGIIISKLGKSLKRKSGKVQQESGIFLSILDETLSGLKVIKSYNSENNFKNKFTDSANKLYHFSNSLLNRNNIASPLSEFLGIVVIATLLWYGGKMVLIDESLKGTDFIGYMLLAYGILTPAKAISKANYTLKSSMAAADRVLEILEQENTITSKENAFIKKSFEDKISISKINFAYNEEKVLENFTLNVPKGKMIALVGQSGSGKSTIANLLTRFYDIQDGDISIDNVSIKDWDIHALRDLMGLVTQDSILFNDSIKNNILIGKPNATNEEIIEALKIANAYEFIKDLPNGIETNIGDAGGKLSGGQKQRLSIARAVLKNPPIMILDEATSALDTESEKLVQIALENMMQNRTSIVIAHRLSTIQKADTIVVMQKGQIVEQGSHTELLAKNGTYANLVNLQSFE